MVNILLIGSGAREHCIAEALKRNKEAQLYSFLSSRNPGLMKISEAFAVGNIPDIPTIVAFAKQHKVGYAIVGPEAPLEKGVVDALQQENILCASPTKRMAQLETSKSFTRNLLQKYKIKANPKFQVFTSMDGMKEFIEKELEGNFVVKADGLKGGKGVKVFGDHLKTVEEGIAYATQCIQEAGKVVIEEKMIGQEFSLMSFSDGKNIVSMPPAQDHKRAFEHDEGPNTGGMGSYSCEDHLLPFLTEEEMEKAHGYNKKTIATIEKETGQQYKGILYGGFMATKNGVKIVEYNARFGDPETMNALPILETDFFEIVQAICNGTLKEIKTKITFANKATVCKYVVPEGYPDNPTKNEKIALGLVPQNVKAYFAAVDEREDGLYMTGSRAMAFTGIAESLEEAEKAAEFAASQVKGRVFHRRDIGTKELVEKRIRFMQLLRG